MPRLFSLPVQPGQVPLPVTGRTWSASNVDSNPIGCSHLRFGAIITDRNVSNNIPRPNRTFKQVLQVKFHTVQMRVRVCHTVMLGLDWKTPPATVYHAVGPLE